MKEKSKKKCKNEVLTLLGILILPLSMCLSLIIKMSAGFSAFSAAITLMSIGPLSRTSLRVLAGLSSMW